ncbi:unnamed protein product [Meloidogyne enterolobii]|uniref:Uncharacterized protein n=1 Tax=Meloidogyne enterolobii TaxID=390850 RepID=A0ACB0ZC25_MELEN
MLRPNKTADFSLLHTSYRIHSVFRVAFLHINNQILEVIVAVFSHNFLRCLPNVEKIVFQLLAVQMPQSASPRRLDRDYTSHEI